MQAGDKLQDKTRERVHQLQRPASRLRHPTSWCIRLFISMTIKFQIPKQVVTSRNNVIYHTAQSDSAHDLQYKGRLQNCERRLSALSVRLSVCPHGTTWLPLDGFSWNLVLTILQKSVEKIRVSLQSDKKNGYSAWRSLDVFDHISLNSSYIETCFKVVEKIKTRILRSITFFFFFFPFMK
jgi:hypothetical protein